MDYYEVRQVYKNMHLIAPVKLEHPDIKYLACVAKSESNYKFNFQVWDEQGEVFHYDKGKIIVLFRCKQ